MIKRLTIQWTMMWAGLLGAIVMMGAQAQTPSYQPTADELRTVGAAYQKAASGQGGLQQASAKCPEMAKAQDEFNKDVQEFNAALDKVVKAHNWPAGTRFDPQTMTFEAPVATAPAPGGKK